jgi:FK506-binding protein 2
MKAALLLSALKIDRTHSVECERKTKSGDKLTMHYRGTLLASGKQFDASEYLY